MKSYWIRPESGKTTLELRDAPVPEPGPGQLLVRMRAAGLNRGELIVGHSVKAGGPAKAAGNEGAGEIAKLGAGVTGFKTGERVMGRCTGAFAEYSLMDAREALAVPKNLTWEEAGSIPLAFMVVHDMLIAQGRLKSGEWLLVTGISAGVGVAALQTAKALGAKVIGTSGSAEKLDKLKALGLDAGVRTRSPDFAEAVMKATGGKGANLVVNNVGGSVFAETIRLRGQARDRRLRRRRAEERDRHRGAAHQTPHLVRRQQSAAQRRTARRNRAGIRRRYPPLHRRGEDPAARRPRVSVLRGTRSQELHGIELAPRQDRGAHRLKPGTDHGFTARRGFRPP